jgi:hypothetical protein
VGITTDFSLHDSRLSFSPIRPDAAIFTPDYDATLPRLSPLYFAAADILLRAMHA